MTQAMLLARRALRVLSAMSCMKPANTTAQSALSATSSTKPSGPLAIVMPKISPSRTIATVISTLLAPSATSRPSTIAVRGTGVARSLSK